MEIFETASADLNHRIRTASYVEYGSYQNVAGIMGGRGCLGGNSAKLLRPIFMLKFYGASVGGLKFSRGQESEYLGGQRVDCVGPGCNFSTGVGSKFGRFNRWYVYVRRMIRCTPQRI